MFSLLFLILTIGYGVNYGTYDKLIEFSNKIFSEIFRFLETSLVVRTKIQARVFSNDKHQVNRKLKIDVENCKLYCKLRGNNLRLFIKCLFIVRRK